jgi:putative hemolysin
MQSIPSLAPYAEKVALTITVVIITYLSLAALPAVKLLSLSTELVLWLLRIKPNNEPIITQEEIKLLLAQGTEEGVFEDAERRFMENILRLDDIN